MKLLSFILILFCLNTAILSDPIHDAAKEGNLETIKKLVKDGADVKAKDYKGITPLYYAANYNSEHEKIDIVKFLINNGANVNAKNNEGMTPLHIAVYFENLDVVKFLVVNGADINAKDDEGKTPLHKAARYANTEAVKFLVVNGADVNTKDKEGYTPIQLAARHNNLVTVEILSSLERKKESETIKKDDQLVKIEQVETLLEKINIPEQKEKIEKIKADLKDLKDFQKNGNRAEFKKRLKKILTVLSALLPYPQNVILSGLVELID
jgi:ankyrin repeat protein